MQKLILPINKCRLTASWKTDSYRAKYGFTHYGNDMVSQVGDRTLFASGNGTVLVTGTDSIVGNVVAVLYPQALHAATGKTDDVVLRYFHLESIAVKKGQAVTKDTKLGVYGHTGYLTMPNHLHIEADTDTQHPLYSPTVKNGSLIVGTLRGANDTTMSSAVSWLHAKTSAPDNQTYTTANDIYIRAEDKKIATIE